MVVTHLRNALYNNPSLRLIILDLHADEIKRELTSRYGLGFSEDRVFNRLCSFRIWLHHSDHRLSPDGRLHMLR